MFVEHKEALEITEAPAKITKLSEAIRIGCTMSPEVRNKQSYYGKCGGTCALGAAHEALIGRARKDCGICGALEAFLQVPHRILAETVSHFYGHSREQTADWLEAQGY